MHIFPLGKGLLHCSQSIEALTLQYIVRYHTYVSNMCVDIHRSGERVSSVPAKGTAEGRAKWAQEGLTFRLALCSMLVIIFMVGPAPSKQPRENTASIAETS